MAESWRLAAACRGMDPDLFFPEKGNIPHEARVTCANCRVSEACLEYALTNREKRGVWGGLSEKQRRRLRRQRRTNAHQIA